MRNGTVIGQWVTPPGQCRGRRVPSGASSPVPRSERSTSAVSSAATTASQPLSSVLPIQPAPVAGLLQGVTGEHPVANRFAGVEGDPGQPVGHRVTHVLEVRRAAPDHRAQAGHGVVAAGQFGRHHRQLHRPGHPDHPRVIDPALLRGGHRAVHQGVGDLGVPAGGHDGQGQPGGVHRLLPRAASPAHCASPDVRAARRKPAHRPLARAWRPGLASRYRTALTGHRPGRWPRGRAWRAARR